MNEDYKRSKKKENKIKRRYDYKRSKKKENKIKRYKIRL